MSFRHRLLIAFSLLIAITYGIGGTLLISTSFHSVLEEEKDSIINEYETIQSNLLMLDFFGDNTAYENMSAMLEQMDEQKLAHWQAVSLSVGQNSIYESGEKSLLPDNVNISDEKEYAIVFKIEKNAKRIKMYSELKAESDTLYLKASYDLSSAYRLREKQQKMFVMIYIVVILLGIGMASVISYILTNRLNELTIAAREIAGGDLNRRTALKTGDEFEQLSRDFDSMAEKLQVHILQLEEDVQRKETFLGSVAHELKTPLTSIIGYADLIRQCALNENDRMTAANYIYKEGIRLEKLSFKILELLMMENDIPSMKEIYLDALMDEISNQLTPFLGEKKIELECYVESIKIKVEPDLIKSLIYNLVDNAVKSMESEGKVSIYGKAIPGGCELKIIDSGCGMDERELSRITDAFYRVDKSRSRKQGGAGLGLALCKKIVDLHRGNMRFQSEKGKGTCVTVELYGSKENLG